MPVAFLHALLHAQTRFRSNSWFQLLIRLTSGTHTSRLFGLYGCGNRLFSLDKELTAKDIATLPYQEILYTL